MRRTEWGERSRAAVAVGDSWGDKFLDLGFGPFRNKKKTAKRTEVGETEAENSQVKYRIMSKIHSPFWKHLNKNDSRNISIFFFALFHFVVKLSSYPCPSVAHI